MFKLQMLSSNETSISKLNLLSYLRLRYNIFSKQTNRVHSVAENEWLCVDFKVCDRDTGVGPYVKYLSNLEEP